MLAGFGARDAIASEPREAPVAAAPSSSGATSGDKDSSQNREEARVRYARGTELFGEGEYALSLIELERAYSLSPAFKMLYNIAQVHQQLGHYAKAVAALERYLMDGGDRVPSDRRAEVEKDLRVLRDRTAMLIVRVTPDGADVSVDGVSFGRTPLPERTRTDAGEHAVVISKAGFASYATHVTLAGGDERVVSASLLRELSSRTTASPSGTSSGMWTTVAWGSAGAVSAASVVFGVLAMNARADLDNQRNTLGTTADMRAETSSKARTLGLTTDVLVGAAVFVSGLALYLTVGKSRSAPPTATRAVSNVGLRF